MATDRLGGLSEMIRTLDRVSGAARKAARAGVMAGLASLSKSTKKAIDASNADADLKRIAKQTIGHRLTTKATAKRDAGGKFGFAVGSMKTKLAKTRAGLATERAGDTSRPGVGVGRANIHWFVVGTDERQKKSGDPTGRMDPTLDGVIDMAISSGAAQAISVAAEKSKQVLAREVAKAKSKG